MVQGMYLAIGSKIGLEVMDLLANQLFTRLSTAYTLVMTTSVVSVISLEKVKLTAR